jgi:hypothetical protein
VYFAPATLPLPYCAAETPVWAQLAADCEAAVVMMPPAPVVGAHS